MDPCSWRLLLVVAWTLATLLACRGDVLPDICEPDLLTSSGEVQATSADIEVWALIFATYEGLTEGEPIFAPVGEDVKIVWRATGEGDIALQAVGPNGSKMAPIWDPAPHLSSSWDSHPGEEWGTVWEFPETGCWSIELRRNESVAYLDIDVRA